MGPGAFADDHLLSPVGINRNALCFELSDCLVHGKPLPHGFETSISLILPQVDYFSIALVASSLDYLLHYPVLEAGQPVAGAVAATAKCRPGTAAWQAFQSRSSVSPGRAFGGLQAFADWDCLPVEVATVVTVPLDTARGVVGTGTFASSKGAVLDPTRISWFACLLGQCLAHCRCLDDLQVAVSDAVSRRTSLDIQPQPAPSTSLPSAEDHRSSAGGQLGSHSFILKSRPHHVLSPQGHRNLSPPASNHHSHRSKLVLLLPPRIDAAPSGVGEGYDAGACGLDRCVALGQQVIYESFFGASAGGFCVGPEVAAWACKDAQEQVVSQHGALP
ncbi:hypothetical protein WJX73_003459 [Symbiochloris irregularis]|uniref:Uncharacterized protein n=1 Tax=Symbiochloris irregularis TaxID=706552 RepID=A0AAW1P900_9CHLO